MGIHVGKIVIIFSLMLMVGLAYSDKKVEITESGFYNHSGCLYIYHEGGNFTLITDDGSIIEKQLSVSNLEYDDEHTRCVDSDEPGKIVFTFDLENKEGKDSKDVNPVTLVNVSIDISAALDRNYWNIPQASVTITRKNLGRRPFHMNLQDRYAGSEYSYSCKEFTMHSVSKKKNSNTTATVTVTLERFQLQPFPELPEKVFADSYDCSRWVTIPGIMGFLLMLFVTLVTLFGVSFLAKIEINDLKFSKEGLSFTQAQLESSKRIN